MKDKSAILLVVVSLSLAVLFLTITIGDNQEDILELQKKALNLELRIILLETDIKNSKNKFFP